MGWMSWERYRCIIDCETWPNSCINEDLYVNAGKALVKFGYKDAGYEYVSIDDCWAAKVLKLYFFKMQPIVTTSFFMLFDFLQKRDPNTNQLVGDPKRFPKGMAYIGEELHKIGLKVDAMIRQTLNG
jgi:alpha-galactosidase